MAEPDYITLNTQCAVHENDLPLVLLIGSLDLSEGGEVQEWCTSIGYAMGFVRGLILAGHVHGAHDPSDAMTLFKMAGASMKVRNALVTLAEHFGIAATTEGDSESD